MTESFQDMREKHPNPIEYNLNLENNNLYFEKEYNPREEYLTLRSEYDRLELAVLVVRPKAEPDGKIYPKGIIQFSHGMAEHKERYLDFMRFLSDNGYLCIIHDHRGHGKSVSAAQDLGYFYTSNTDVITEDLFMVTKYAKKHWPGLPVFIFSHSMGTLAARKYLKKHDDEIEALVMSGPPTENTLVGFALFLAKLFSAFGSDRKPNRLLNAITFLPYTRKFHSKFGWTSSNPESVKKYEKDPLCGFTFTTNGFLNLYKLMKECFVFKDWKPKHRSLPIFMIAGAQDPVISSGSKFGKLEAQLINLGYRNVKSSLYEDMRHELINEIDNQRIYHDVLNFFDDLYR